MRKVLLICLTALFLSACSQVRVVCSSDGDLIQQVVSPWGNTTKVLEADNQVCTYNPDGSYTVQDMDQPASEAE